MQSSSQSTGSAPLAVLNGVLEHITYTNEDTGYTVARVAGERGGAPVTVVGPLLGAQAGEPLHLEGRWRNHPLYGRQFEVRSYRAVLPATVQGIRRYLGSGLIRGIGPKRAGAATGAVPPPTLRGTRRYLGSGLIRGIGPKMAERIVDQFGVDTLKVLEEDPGRLRSVPGLGPTRTAMIEQAWEEQKAIKDVMIFLQGVGVSTSLAVRIYKAYREEAIKVVTHAPYRLATDVWGIGFKTADKIAQGVGIAYDSGE